jgi:cytochrome P450
MRRSELPPGPRLPRVLQNVGMWARMAPYGERLRRRYGKRFTIRLVGIPTWVVHSEPEHIKEIFTAPPDVLHPGEGAGVLRPVVGSNSVILLDEGAHMEQRKLMLPAFHGEKMKRLAGLMEEVTEREVASWPRGEPVEMHPRMQHLTMEIILRAVFGLDPGERLDALRERLSAMLKFGDRPISLTPPPEGSLAERVLEKVGPFAHFVRLQEQADALIFEQIDERRAEAAERDDILSMLLEARHEDGSPMSSQELRDELMTLLVAGHETTATSLAWAFERLTRTPEVLDRLSAEIASDDGDTYLTATIQETLRRRPVLPNAAPRLVVKEVEIGGWTYQPGVAMVVSTYLLHHDADVYPDPYAFRPERFLEEGPGTYTWTPFGGGRRRCLGASFATQEMKIVLRQILAGCEIAAGIDGPELTRHRNITVRPGEGARTILRDREPHSAPAESAEPAEAAV